MRLMDEQGLELEFPRSKRLTPVITPGCCRQLNLEDASVKM